jgi:chromate transporter
MADHNHRNAQRKELEQAVPLAALFTAFVAVSLYGVGGGSGIVWARRIAVENRRWISDREFADIVSLCQFMPGPNIVGIAVCVGAKMRGTVGTIAAVSGFLVIPWAIGFSVGLLLRSALAVSQQSCRMSATLSSALMAG